MMPHNNGILPYSRFVALITVARYDRSIAPTFSVGMHLERSSPLHGRIMAAIAIGQVPRTGATAQQQELLLNGFETKSVAAAWAAIGKLGRTPAAAQQQGRARLDLADPGQDGR